MKATRSEISVKHLGKDIYTIELENDQGMKVRLSNYGGIIQSIVLPDRYGNFIDVVLGFDHIKDYLSEDYLAHYCYFGAVIGRYANRIGHARFPLNGQMVEVSANMPPHQLHGGFSGYDKQIWQLVSVEEKPVPKVVLSHLSRDGGEGFPGNLKVKISYELNNLNELMVKMEAQTDRATPINLCNHPYFNLNGEGSSIAHHVVEIPADHYLAQDADYVVTGELLETRNSSHDFIKPTAISQNWKEGEGYDQAFVLNKPYGTWGRAATAYSGQTGIKLEVLTDQPGVQFYTGNHLYIKNGKKGMHYRPFTSFCLETQHHPNSVNVPAFPNTILQPGEKYIHQTAFKFSVE